MPISAERNFSKESDEAWKTLMLTPHDYGKEALFHPKTRELMQKITFAHGGQEYDSKYPDGIPTSIDISLKSGKTLSSGLVMYPPGHARNTTADLKALLARKNKMLGDLVFTDAATLEKFLSALIGMKNSPAEAMQTIYDFDFSKIRGHKPIDGERPKKNSKL
jgi:2-methylcitrate dehydratase